MTNETTPLTELFGCNVFSDAVMREKLSEKTYEEFKKGTPLSLEVADEIAEAMKEWAMSKGATHYTHLFQPLTGLTAEKHDGFINPDGMSGKAIMEFTGEQLIKGEPDASSFPSGGIRATFEARGYTAWDTTSPAFLKEDASGVTLCIPTAFCSYTGEALDKKTPLLRSCDALSKAAIRVLKQLGDSESTKVVSTVGPEQEYFLLSKAHIEARKDIKITGRTLFGAPSPKGQEMEDSYFGSLRENVACFMKEVDTELYKLGIFAKTKHNEVAPCQHEIACVYSPANIAVDSNYMVMETLKRCANHYGLVCLLHEKPFKGLNGSGKHNNWSLSTDTGKNLLKPGKDPVHNIEFLVFLAATMEAVSEHSGLLRASAGNPGNDHRLGGNEAPPSIVSMFLGDALDKVVESIIADDENVDIECGKVDLGASTIPEFEKDNTDRNRTSPFAFTGNKFEFRMVGSSASIAGPNTVINAIVAQSLNGIADRLEKADDKVAEAHAVVKEIFAKHYPKIVFNGNGYSEEWVKEAERRGLPNLPSSIEAFSQYNTEKSVEMFESLGIYTKAELESRYEIRMEKYFKINNYECLTMLDMVRQEIIPAVSDYLKFLGETVQSMASIGMTANVEKSIIEKIAPLYEKLYETTEEFGKAVRAAEVMDVIDAANNMHDVVIPLAEKVREYADAIEPMVSKDFWPMPTYADMLFY
ncbi:MAG: glutamine synthetase III [Clostridia bacterium]|nr:glutamine synthetase III [Clostridia bacterium]